MQVGALHSLSHAPMIGAGNSSRGREPVMPKTVKGKGIARSMRKTYGARAEEVFHRSANKGTIKGVHKKSAKKKRR